MCTEFAFKKAQAMWQQYLRDGSLNKLPTVGVEFCGSPAPGFCPLAYAAETETAANNKVDKLQTNMQVYSRLGGIPFDQYKKYNTAIYIYSTKCRVQIFSTNG